MCNSLKKYKVDTEIETKRFINHLITVEVGTDDSGELIGEKKSAVAKKSTPATSRGESYSWSSSWGNTG